MSKFALEGLLAMRARRIARPQNPDDQRLPSATDTHIWTQIEGNGRATK